MRGFVQALLAATLLAMATGCSGGSSGTASEQKRFTVSGEVLLVDDVTMTRGGRACTGDRATSHRDVRRGAQVIVFDADMDKAATGTLMTGTPDGGACRFGFSVDGVPAGDPRYSVGLDGRSTYVVFMEARADEVSLVLGRKSRV